MSYSLYGVKKKDGMPVQLTKASQFYQIEVIHVLFWLSWTDAMQYLLCIEQSASVTLQCNFMRCGEDIKFCSDFVSLLHSSCSYHAPWRFGFCDFCSCQCKNRAQKDIRLLLERTARKREKKDNLIAFYSLALIWNWGCLWRHVKIGCWMFCMAINAYQTDSLFYRKKGARNILAQNIHTLFFP